MFLFLHWQDGSTTSKLVLRAADIATELAHPDNILVECLASHPELGEDFITYAHTVEIMCKSIKFFSFRYKYTNGRHYLK